MPNKSLVFILILSLFYSVAAAAKEYIPNGPMITRTQNPIYLQSLGQIPVRAKTLEKGMYSNWFDASYTNLFEYGNHNTNQVYMDMELARLAFNIFYGLGDDMDIGLQVPFLHFNGGYFDSWIQAFHRAFGFPNGGREYFPNNQFVYRLTKNGSGIYNVRARDIGLSDIILAFKHNCFEETENIPGFAWTFRFKFPTGNPSGGTGSGNIDYSLGFVAEKSIGRFHFYTNLDYMVIGGSTIFPELYYNQVFAWLTTFEFSVSRPVSLLIQLQGSTPMLTGMGIEDWDGFPMDLVIGVKGTHKKLFWGSDFFWQWGFSEDVASEGPSADITTMIVLGVEFGNSN